MKQSSATSLQVSRTAVAKYLEWFRTSGLTWEQAQELPDSELVSVLGGHRASRSGLLPAPQCRPCARRSTIRLSAKFYRSTKTSDAYRRAIENYLADWVSRPLNAIERREVEARFTLLTRNHGWAIVPPRKARRFYHVAGQQYGDP